MWIKIFLKRGVIRNIIMLIKLSFLKYGVIRNIIM